MIIVQPFGNFTMKFNEDIINFKHIKSKKVLTLIKFLIFNRNQTYTNEDMYEQLCSESENPSSALKNLVYRAKNLLLDTSLPCKQYIVLKDGVYRWNNEIEVVLLSDEFEKNILNANRNGCEDREKIECYEKAVDIYKDYFLPDIQYEKWVIPIARYYHSMYISCVNNLCKLYINSQQYKKVITVCRKVLKIDHLQEDAYYNILISYMQLNKNQEAYDLYNTTEKLFYDELGVPLSSETRELYKQIMEQLTNEERNIEAIQKDLLKDESEGGAYICNYEIFKNIYKVYTRAIKRTNEDICIMLATLINADGTIPEKDVIIKKMKVMESVLSRQLRMGDVVSRYSGTQFVVMIPNLSPVNGEKIIIRISDAYKKKSKDTTVEFRFKTAFIK